MRYRIAPVRIEEGTLVVASEKPYQGVELDELRQVVGLPLRIVLASEQEIQQLIRQHYGIGAETVEAMLQAEETVPLASSLTEAAEDLDAIGGEASVIRVVNQLLSEAVKERATDIHLEPFERSMAVRYRIDGVLYDLPVPPRLYQFYPALLSRIKVMANLNVAEHRLPQDGRAKVRVQGRQIDLRISILPTPEGETAMIRLLNTNILLGLEQLGLLPDHQAVLERLLTRPHGILLVTGPTGSGKTTTLYASLVKLNDRMKKILTIEDPIEYRLPGVTQMQVHPKIDFTFARALRSMLRHDPDVMMVGEIRDLETAEIAIRTALTGHLVFSTLHTNDAAGSVSRLLDMGVESYLVSSSLECAVAQRLVRLLCPQCKGTRCSACRQTGYQGRTAIFEFMVLGEEIRRLIVNRVPANQIKALARKQGMRTLREDGMLKVKQGLTTEAEVMRVTQSDE
ncbi:MAG: type II/IV secretion system protein [Elusimicrobia bacterium]|nr:type II/IV secretion system protein [Elusimicrobiota bacterium]